jgi:ribosomal protein L37AE/L43A
MNNNLFNHIQILISLEESLGDKLSRKTLEPFPLHSNDVVGIENAGKIIAKFVGLGDCNFIINFKENTDYAGKINLIDQSKNIKIVISREILDYPEVILATLSHEITHKFLSINQFSFENNYKNELATDIATLLIGFGKLVLNGVYVAKVNRLDTLYFSSVLKDEVKIGYLSSEHFAFLYILINHLRQMPKKSYCSGLSRDAKDIIEKCLTEYGKVLDLENLLNKNADYTEFKENLNLLLSKEKKKVIYLKKAIEELNSEIYLNLHKNMADISSEEEIIAGVNNPKLKEIYQFKINLKKYNLKKGFKEQAIKIDKLEKIYKLVRLKIDLKGKIDSLYDYISCPNCGSKLRLKRNKKSSLIKCPKCNYQFDVDTTKETSEIKNNFNKLRKLSNKQ